MLSLLKKLNLALAFLLELGVLAALCYIGFSIETYLLLKITLGIGLPVVAIVIWSLFGAPMSDRRLQGFPFLLLQIVFFGSAATALYAVGQHTLCKIFILLFMLNTILAYGMGSERT